MLDTEIASFLLNTTSSYLECIAQSASHHEAWARCLDKGPFAQPQSLGTQARNSSSLTY